MKHKSMKDKILKYLNNKIKKMDKNFVPNLHLYNAGYNKGYYDALVYCVKYISIYDEANYK